jgi:hypothetical protein
MSSEGTQTFMGIPVMVVPRWKLIMLRILYPRDWFVQRGDRIYIIRDVPAE